jgi:para-aminobenzoate synthetase/4-amino-4-deoxychorismate lyase
VIELQPDIDRAKFDTAIARIHEAIADGETYQVNHTYRLHGSAWGEPIALYRRLRARQRVGYGALLRLPRQGGDTVEWVLSRSPELFVRHAAGRLTARPMKAPRRARRRPRATARPPRWLHGDVKNRAENLMIVDLCATTWAASRATGSVRVPQLFSIEPFATVFQMTSTVEAERRSEVGLAGLLRALFPCGSITGAPKHTHDGVDRALEAAPRGCTPARSAGSNPAPTPLARPVPERRDPHAGAGPASRPGCAR